MPVSVLPKTDLSPKTSPDNRYDFRYEFSTTKVN